MRLAGVREGDIVQVAGSKAMVERVERGRLLVRWMTTRQRRWATSRQVEAIWRRPRRR